MFEISSNHKILIIEPHSDDSFISAAGMMIKNRNKLNIDFCLITASDLNLNHGFVSRESRIQEYQEYVKYFGGQLVSVDVVEHSTPLDFESRLDLFPKAALVKIIETAIFNSQPDVLMFMGPSFHHDHTILYEAIIAALRPTIQHRLKTSLIMENPTYVHDGYGLTKPNFYVGLDEEIVNEKAILFSKLFPSQHRENANYLSSNGMTRWARYRGLEAQLDFAEAFRIFKTVA